MFRRTLLIILVVVIIFPYAKGVSAQVAPSNDITINLTPENPGPNQSITLSVQSYSFDLTGANIEWSVDGNRISGGIGKVSFTLMTKSVGTSTSVTVVITPLNGIQTTKHVVITPMSVDLLWEATDSIIPPFYRGKAMTTSESQVKIVALPQIKSSSGTFLPPSNFTYNWSEQYNGDENNSGYGKNSFLVAMDYLNPTNHVDVSVATIDGLVATKAAIDVNPSTPQLLWYTVNPLYGPVFDTVLSTTVPIKEAQTSVLAEPYFFSPDSSANPTTYEWMLNEQTIETPKTPNVLTLVRSDSSTGTATVDLTIRNATKLFQDVTGHLTLLLQQ